MAREPEPLRVVPRYEPEIIHKRRDAALQVDADAGAVQDAHCAAPPPRARTEAEAKLVKYWGQRCVDLSDEMRRLSPQQAAHELLRELAALAIVEHRQRAKLEQRIIAKLERSGKRLKRLRKRLKLLESGRSKPRVRVPAGRSEQ